MAIKQIFDIGDQPVVTAKFYNLADVLTNPTTVAVQVLPPSGTITYYPPGNGNIATSSTGIYTFTFPTPLDESGDWSVKFLGTGTVTAAEETILPVRETKFAYPPV